MNGGNDRARVRACAYECVRVGYTPVWLILAANSTSHINTSQQLSDFHVSTSQNIDGDLVRS